VKREISNAPADAKIPWEAAYTRATTPTGRAPDVLPCMGLARRVYRPPWQAS
jgi:hypothetical protein